MHDRKGRPRAALHFDNSSSDNRDSSTDSRVLSAVGFIPIENVIGRAGTIFFSLDAGGNGTPPAIRYGRIGTLVQ